MLTLEKPLFVRECADGMCRPITYLLAKFVDELFITVFASMLFATIVFFVVDVQATLVVFWVAFLLTVTIGNTLAYVISILSPNMDVANGAHPTYKVRSCIAIVELCEIVHTSCIHSSYILHSSCDSLAHPL